MEVTITGTNFDNEVVHAEIPVLVDFWAEWCMPCKMLTPILDELARDYDGKLKIGKLNVDEQPELAAKYNVVSIPTLLLFKNGKIVGQHVGAAPRVKLEELFKQYIN